jgi:hypothetical protein
VRWEERIKEKGKTNGGAGEDEDTEDAVLLVVDLAVLARKAVEEVLGTVHLAELGGDGGVANPSIGVLEEVGGFGLFARRL